MRTHFLKTFLVVCLLITLLTAIPFPVQAAVVVLRTAIGSPAGSSKCRISGWIDTPSAGIIKIKWEEIESLTTERPMSVKLYGEADIPDDAGEQRHDRYIVRRERGRFRLRMCARSISLRTIIAATSAPAAIKRSATRRLKP